MDYAQSFSLWVQEESIFILLFQEILVFDPIHQTEKLQEGGKGRKEEIHVCVHAYMLFYKYT